MNREQMILDCQLLSHTASFFMLQEVIKREYAALRKSAKLPPVSVTSIIIIIGEVIIHCVSL